MAKIYDIDTNEVITLDEMIEYLDAKGDRPLDTNIEETALQLRKLCNDREFVINTILKDMEDEEKFNKKNVYTAQVFILHASPRYTIRICVWEPAVGRAGENVFFYEDPHDHNFKLLTVGYLGSGYKTELYKYDHNKTIGMDGEPVDVEYTDTINLDYQRVLFLEESSDIHTQLPPKEMSISLNILQPKKGRPLDQYSFNIEKQDAGYKASIRDRLSERNIVSLVKLSNGYQKEKMTQMLRDRISKEKDDQALFILYSALEHLQGKGVWNELKENSSHYLNTAAQLKLAI